MWVLWVTARARVAVWLVWVDIRGLMSSVQKVSFLDRLAVQRIGDGDMMKVMGRARVESDGAWSVLDG